MSVCRDINNYLVEYPAQEALTSLEPLKRCTKLLPSSCHVILEASSTHSGTLDGISMARSVYFKVEEEHKMKQHMKAVGECF